MKKALLSFLVLGLATVLAAQPKPGPKVFISVDMEGIWGVVHGSQTSPDSPEYGAARKWMAEDVNAAIAGYSNVPVIMLSGDEETCSQAKAILGPSVLAVAVKKAKGRYAAELFPLEEVRKNLAQGAREALANRAKVKPFCLEPPLSFELEFLNSGQAEMHSLLPQVRRTGARSVAFAAADIIEGFKLMRAVIALAGIS